MYIDKIRNSFSGTWDEEVYVQTKMIRTFCSFVRLTAHKYRTEIGNA